VAKRVEYRIEGLPPIEEMPVDQTYEIVLKDVEETPFTFIMHCEFIGRK